MIIQHGNGVALRIQKKFGYPQGLGALVIGGSDIGRNDGLTGGYQIRRTKKSGEIQVLSRDTTPSNPRTYIQQANRNRFGDAMRAWQNLPSAEQEKWKNKVKYTNKRGHNIFIKEYMRDNI